MFFKTSDDIKIAFDDYGKKEQQPVILLSGIGGSRLIWSSQVTALINAGYRVINVDARNQGESQHTTRGLRISRHAIDIHELLEYLKADNVIFIGNSMGAATIFAYISLYGYKEVKAIIDVDQSPKMISTPDWPYGFKNLTWDNFPEELMMSFRHATFTRIDDELFSKIKKVNAAHPYDRQLNYLFLVDHSFQDWRDIISCLKVPLLIIAGRQSPYFNPDFAEAAVALAPMGEARVIDNCGHIVMAEQAAAYNNIMFNFLKKV
ncbi:alpha/beta fold hydrolase [Liquorilactobacillus oeni]|uniref:AB hydrolase-1 domain-containing protein n=1 Tax=Liquorilactobacillus oeni DSM 19972 TaxID=1423777 RepID=A0A0R1MJL8_9LACO|nr:alpha/beta hydrolase [Liquorilactobacillus oeni]KRL05370.1 hypothetical protein FD46_GL000771 [Liquorilactobacillus oeni DSM 19972]